MRNILCYGDSNTWGYIPKNSIPDDCDNRYDEETRWTGRLSSMLGKDYRVIEEGLNGRTTVFVDPIQPFLTGISFLECCEATHKPIDLVILMLGTNDLKGYLGTDAYNIARGIDRLIRKIRENPSYGRDGKAPEILLVCPADLGQGIADCWTYPEFGAGCLERQKGMPEYYESVAKTQGCHFLNANRYVSVSPKDCVHLDEEGHQILAGILYKTITDIFSH